MTLKATTAIRLYNQLSSEIVKSDKRMRDVGITNGARLQVTMHPSDPEIYALFVARLNEDPKKIDFAEVIDQILYHRSCMQCSQGAPGIT